MNTFKIYKDYKESGIEWLNKIPSEWNLIKLSRLIKIFGSIDVEESITEGYDYFKVDSLNYAEGLYVKESTSKVLSSKSPLEPNLILIPKRGAAIFTNKVKITSKPCYIDPNVMAIRTERVEIEYLAYYLLARRLEDIADVSTIPQINNKQINSIQLPIPTITEQKKISRFLKYKTKEIDSLINYKSKLIKLLEEKRQLMITKAVTKGLNPNVKMKDSGVEWIGEIPEHWECLKFKYSGKLINGYAFPSGDFTTSGVRVMKITNIQSMKIDWGDESFVDKVYYDKLPQFRVHKDDLVFALTRPIISSGIKAAIVNTEEKILLNQRNALYRSGNKIMSTWLYYIMLHKLFVQEFESYIDQTGQQPNISSADIENIKIPVPTLEEQHEIGSYLDNKSTVIDNVIEENKQLIEKLKEYRQSLIYEAVTGKIDVRDFEIEE